MGWVPQLVEPYNSEGKKGAMRNENKGCHNLWYPLIHLKIKGAITCGTL